MNKSLASKSRFLSLVLRHDPGAIGLTLDGSGWADVSELLDKAASSGTPISRDELLEIVETNEKRRFDLDLVRERIRANQGHSIEVDLELPPTVPPEVLFHGTAEKNRDAILAQGIIRGARQHVHLSGDVETARAVGSRHGRPIVFRVASGEMYRAQFAFYLSKNGVWLTHEAPPQFLQIL